MNRFEEFWKEYPRKISKGSARKSYQRALELTDEDTIFWGAKAYSAATHGEDPRYVKHPATWLNQECWDDEHQKKFDWGMVTYSASERREAAARKLAKEAEGIRLVK